MAQERQESNLVAAVRAVAEILAQQDRRVEASEVEEAAKEAYKSAKRNRQVSGAA